MHNLFGKPKALNERYVMTYLPESLQLIKTEKYMRFTVNVLNKILLCVGQLCFGGFLLLVECNVLLFPWKNKNLYYFVLII